ncbi:unnamed protein product [Rangifer tarandus platyrhynchus]|uniref:Uncharacterized protein n=1 Tax=Rangifer tarandus platyrhynchus TaxID=3082113 RepID=A0AC59ZB85_RANTA
MVSPSSRRRYYSLGTSWRDPVSDWNGAGERSGLAAGPGRVGKVAERQAAAGCQSWSLVSQNQGSILAFQAPPRLVPLGVRALWWQGGMERRD